MNEITKHNNNSLIESIEDIKNMGVLMAKTGVFGGNAGEAIVKILAGRELGIEPFAAMSNINMIEGRPQMSANLMAAKVRSSGKYDYSVNFTDCQPMGPKSACHVTFSQGDREIGVSTYSMDDAKHANLIKPDKPKSGWNRFPQNMLFARAISNGVRYYCPDIFFGIAVYTEGEIEDDDEPARKLDTNDKPAYHASVQTEPVDAGYIDIEEVGQTEGEPEPMPEPVDVMEEPKSERPYSAEVFKDKFQNMAQQVLLKNSLDAVGDVERKLIVDALDGVLIGKAEREAVLEWLTGKGDILQMGKHYLRALCKVMDINETQPAPSGVSMAEMKNIIHFLTGEVK